MRGRAGSSWQAMANLADWNEKFTTWKLLIRLHIQIIEENASEYFVANKHAAVKESHKDKYTAKNKQGLP